MGKLSRLGDKNTTGGKIMKGASTVFVNNKPAGLHESPISPHADFSKPHKKAKTTEGSPTVFIENKPVLRTGSKNSCGHVIITGSPDVDVE